MRLLTGILAFAVALPALAWVGVGSPRVFAAWWGSAGGGVTATWLSYSPAALWLPAETGDYEDIVGGLTPTNAAGTLATITDAGWTFNGTNAYLDFGFPAALEPGTNDFTLAAWVRPARATGEGMGFVGKLFAGNGDRWGVYMSSAAPGYARFLVSSEMQYISADLNFTSNTWLFAAISATNNYISALYVTAYANGASTNYVVGTFDGGNFTFTGGVTCPFRCGAYGTAAGAPAYYFQGDIYAVAHFPRALSVAELDALRGGTAP